MRETGSIVRWFADYGFARRDSGGDVFVHADAFFDPVPVQPYGIRISFETLEGKKGPRAARVRVIHDEAA
jgi:cold shock CspA family protein